MVTFKPIITNAQDAEELRQSIETRLDELDARCKAWKPREIPTFWEWIKSGCKSF